MPRPKVILQSEFPYHVSGRCINKEWFTIPMPEVWTVMERQLWFIKNAYGVKIYAFVLMSNHFHLLIGTPLANLSDVMENFMGETSRALTWAGNRINQTYCGRYHRCLINKEHYFRHAYKYVYRNPVRAGIVEKVEQYKYSTLFGLLGMQHLLIPVEEDYLLISKTEETLEWLNSSPVIKDESTIKSALYKKIFTLPKDVMDKRESHLETDAL